MPHPLAYFLSCTTYGQRVHGDARGSVDALHNRRGTPRLPPDPRREGQVRRAMRDPVMAFGPEARRVVARAVADHAAIRGWTLKALSVRSTHMHVVVDCRPSGGGELVPPEKVLREFKTWGTRRLVAAGLVARGVHVWTVHGSTRWINREEDLIAAIDYVSRLQDLGGGKAAEIAVARRRAELERGEASETT